MENRSITLALIGCTGHVTGLFADEFYKQGIKLRILASDPDKIKSKYPDAEIIQGTMMNPEDVRQVMELPMPHFSAHLWEYRTRKRWK